MASHHRPIRRESNQALVPIPLGVPTSHATTPGPTSYHVGHYGCGRLVKVGSRKKTQNSQKGKFFRTFPKPRQRLACPGCGIEHSVTVSWRKPKIGESRKVELWL